MQWPQLVVAFWQTHSTDDGMMTVSNWSCHSTEHRVQHLLGSFNARLNIG